MPEKTALLLVDVIAGAFHDGSFKTYNGSDLLDNVRKLLARAREAHVPVFHVIEPIDEETHPQGSPARESLRIHPDAAPIAGEAVVPQRHYGAFSGNDLDRRLRAIGIDTVVIAGIATPWCVDTAVRQAYALGYRVVLAKDAHGCTNSQLLPAETIVAHHNAVLRECFADAIDVAEIEF